MTEPSKSNLSKKKETHNFLLARLDLFMELAFIKAMMMMITHHNLNHNNPLSNNNLKNNKMANQLLTIYHSIKIGLSKISNNNSVKIQAKVRVKSINRNIRVNSHQNKVAFWRISITISQNHKNQKLLK